MAIFRLNDIQVFPQLPVWTVGLAGDVYCCLYTSYRLHVHLSLMPLPDVVPFGSHFGTYTAGCVYVAVRFDFRAARCSTIRGGICTSTWTLPSS